MSFVQNQHMHDVAVGVRLSTQKRQGLGFLQIYNLLQTTEAKTNLHAAK